MRGVLSGITCEIAASIPTLRSRSGLGVVWLWSLRWSSADERPVTANTPCYRQKGAPDLKPHAARRRGLAALENLGPMPALTGSAARCLRNRSPIHDSRLTNLTRLLILKHWVEIETAA